MTPSPTLLPGTFVHLRGIGQKTEIRLWRSGVDSWADLRETSFVRRLGLLAAIDQSEEALAQDDLEFFFEALPVSQRWRTYADFSDHFAAIDIETTGLSIYDHLTVVGIEFAGEYRAFVRGANLADAEDVLAAASGLISFNGAMFDLPFLARAFPDLELPKTHVDLRFLSRRVGLAGSLKKVERLARLRRDDEIDDLDGFGATVLWTEYEHGDTAALRKLIRYNSADTCVLRPLADLVVDRLRRDLEESRRAPVDDDQLSLDIETLVPAVRRVARRRPRAPTVRLQPPQTLRIGRQSIDLPADRIVGPSVALSDLHVRMARPSDRVVGIDLTGSDARPSGWALIEDDLVVTGMVASLDELVERTVAAHPRVVSIDSPLSLPIGRHCTDDACECRRVGGITRECERELKRRGISVYPCLIQSMQALTLRGIELASILRAQGLEVIESYPGAAQDIMRIPRKGASQERLHSGLCTFGFRGLRGHAQMTHDELDAVTSAAVGLFFLADLYEALGNEREEYLIIPSAQALQSAGTTPVPALRASIQLMIVGGESPRTTHALRGIDFISGDWEQYWEEISVRGPYIRAAAVTAGPRRRQRRPVFADLSVADDDPRLTRRLRAWAREWAA